MVGIKTVTWYTAPYYIIRNCILLLWIKLQLLHLLLCSLLLLLLLLLQRRLLTCSSTTISSRSNMLWGSRMSWGPRVRTCSLIVS
jgi:hypothetical protein